LLVRAERVFAATHEEALRLAHDKRDQLLDLMALHRQSSGVSFATVVQKLGDPISARYDDTRFLSEAQSYGGNLLGGFISGEDQHTLLGHDRATAADPFLALCLSLYRDAESENDADFAYFRYWSVLELIASERVVVNSPVTDFSGQPILVKNQQARTSHPHGRVYELLKRHMQTRNSAEQNFVGPPSTSLWEEVGVWYTFRNATAHHGGFRVDDPNQQSQPWYQAALAVDNAIAQQGGVVDHLRNLERAARSVMHWELDAAVPRSTS
jgi:hypothetical protein